MNDYSDLLPLLVIPNLTENRLYKLLETFKTPAAVRQAAFADLSDVVGPEIARRVSQEPAARAVDQLRTALARLGIKIVPYYAAEYPAWLKTIDHFPPVIFMRGDLRPTDENAVAIVGTRGATVYGKGVAANFAAEFVKAGITVVSGLARGIDTVAHESALKNGGRTIAVLGCGLDQAYPPENRGLMTEISRQGCVLSEFTIGTPPRPQNFPKRNRIITGLSRAVVAIEAREHSGVMNTVNWAASQGREVFAVPGNIYSRTSAGTNRLIKEGATPVTAATEVMESLGMKTKAAPRTGPVEPMDDQEKIVWQALTADPVFLDEISERTGQSTAVLLKILLRMEIKGLIQQLPGMVFVKNAESHHS